MITITAPERAHSIASGCVPGLEGGSSGTSTQFVLVQVILVRVRAHTPADALVHKRFSSDFIAWMGRVHQKNRE